MSGRDPEGGPVEVQIGEEYTAGARRVRVVDLERTVAILVELCPHGILAEALGECCPPVPFRSHLTWRAGAWRMIGYYKRVLTAPALT